MSATPYQKQFYGRRKGQTLSTRQKRLLDDVLPCVSFATHSIEAGRLNPSTLFEAPPSKVWLEIGFGKGEHLALQAKAHPEIGFIGCEPFINGVAGLVTKIHEQALQNIRIYPDDARHVLLALQPKCIDRVFLLHPDPWQKPRHAKRRFVSDANLEALARVMKKGAELRIGTDHPTFMAWTMVHMQDCPDFTWTAERAADWRNPPADWFETRYAKKAQKTDRNCVYLTFIRN